MTSHADLATLLAYWAGELDEAGEATLEEHYLGCETCAARLAEVEAIARGVKGAFASGQVGAILTPHFIERMRSRGLRMREYVVPRNGSVNCSVGPEDDVLLGRLQVPLDGVERIDLVVDYHGEHRMQDVPFDAATGEVLLAPSVAFMRTLPAHREVVRVFAAGKGGDRLLGEYTFNHSPHQ